MNRTLHRISAAGMCDGAGVDLTPATILAEWSRDGWRIVDWGVELPATENAAITHLPDAVLHPGLVNAHVHLDLTHIGPRPFDPDRGFVGWVDVIRAERHAEPQDVRQSVLDGVARSLEGGVVAVGDIGGASRLEPLDALRESPLIGVSYFEVFGQGAGQAAAITRMKDALRSRPHDDRGIRFGLQPHAPYSAGMDVYAAAVRLQERHGVPLCTHLAETPEEHEFVAAARGPLRELLERLGVWDDVIMEDIGHGRSPVRHLASTLTHGRFAAVHLNDCSDDDIESLRTGADGRPGRGVIYCPRSSEYFGRDREFGAHRYREMMSAGATVALGTDSIINLPPSTTRISTLDEMRRLYARDETDPRMLLAMATINGARVLDLDEDLFRFRRNGRIAGLVATRVRSGGPSASRAIVEGDGDPTLLDGESLT